MFVQVIQGRVSDAAAARARFDTWMTELAPGATGWLGSTAGVTEDGTLVVLARFESEEAAQQNSDRPDQTAWWEETRPVFTGEPEFHNSSRVDLDLPGDPDQARFVQVMQGRTTDPDRARELMNDDSIDWRGFRPDILGSMSLEHDGDAWTMALYFTSEEEARAGESKEPPPEMQKMMQEMEQLSAGEPSYFDLRDPWLHSPG
ncbi:MAG: hypothetical protein AVDCRST_MAG34-1747 [uncultured Nocardioidaceae bacterium]|uniref:ABM domain-containing protein n=1 Tax=uncultured Nocardioidaceae bacterium TaxID=253824 RepID=A0A6J4M605_9ACTN|nr:MAG: hypothetical protein AVDCRST_MAG34-1747 [uncultured Nocardioidaceae bacterium]